MTSDPSPDATHLDWYQWCPQCQTQLQRTAWSAICGNCTFNYYLNPAPCATVVITDEAERILIAQRKFDPFQGCWDLVGGFVNINESPEACALRETREETGLSIELVDQLGEAVGDWYQGLPTLCFLFWGRLDQNSQPQSAQAQDDVARLEWRDPLELPGDFAFTNNQVALERFFQRNRKATRPK